MIETTPQQVDAIVAAAAAAAGPWAAMELTERAAALIAIADRLDAHTEELIEAAGRETHLPEASLRRELTRTTFQLRLFAQVVRAGEFLDVRVDPADPQWPMGVPRPDLRRMKVPLGPVVNFAAGNFPFTLSVAGGDTASALAAGCPVVVKAHPGHPELSRLTARLVEEALVETSAPLGVFGIVYGQDAGVRVLTHPAIAAAAFTGSTAGGRALFDLASRRSVPIPFYGELGSINPVFVTSEAAEARAAEIAAGLFASVSFNSGQLCTKPNVVAVPEDSALLREVRAAATVPVGELLNDAIAAGFAGSVERMSANPGVEVLRDAPDSVRLLSTEAKTVLADPTLVHEMFGPATLLVRYRDDAELRELAASFDGQLTISIFGETSDDTARTLIALAAAKAGRVLWNSWPTGVSVTYAQQHGGPYPATTAPGTTSMGTAAIERFLRPVVFQSVPDELLPRELRAENPLSIPRSVNGSRPR
ncbi:aldehyde dehydrogenase (NADP(+)) [Nocardia panacis]|uniref:Aldehyde dehydrogenase (NADP(+)) n=1 Tax=Nocardia panacis TaxID=2340916 RepID=A0A3A4KUR8_9NOCA|nr:aldehyde dehydrogenase (NADP(+)) [Nocardia panacis]RJO78841.1 aldehyde dehydrogenase (NADP(+)) [Nocardia panacis]